MNLLAAIISCLGALLQPAGDDVIVGASSADHLFVVYDADAADPGVDLVHHGRAMDGATVDRLMPLTDAPQALAAWRDTLWLLMAPEGEDATTRKVFRIRVVHNTLYDRWYVDPPGRLDVVRALPSAAPIQSATGTPSGPLVVVDEPDGPRLFALRGRWETIDLPEPVVGGRVSLLPDDEGDISLLHERDGRISMYTLGEGGVWSAVALEGAGRLAGATSVGRYPLVMTDAGEQISLAYIHPPNLADLATIDRPEARWGIFGLDDGIRLVEHRLGALRMTRIDRTTGELGADERVTLSRNTGPLLPLMLIWAAIGMVMILVFFFRAAPGSVVLPPTLALLPMGPRFWAVLIDLLPGAIVAMLVLRCPPEALLRTPVLAADLGDTTPNLLMLAVAFMHCTLGEMLIGRTLGKTLVGGRVTSITGGRVGPARIFARNVVKTLVLLMPPLAIFVVMNPYQQGPGDQLARTLVVCPIAAPKAD